MKKRYLVLFILLLLLIDQIVKIVVKTHMTLDQHIAVFGEWFYIRFIENPGAAYGFQFGGSYGKLFLSLFRIAAVGFLVWFLSSLIRRRAPKGVLIGFALIIAGATGNILDSAYYGLIFDESGFSTLATLFPEGGGYASFLHGKVVDMLYFPIIRSAWPEWIPGIGGRSFEFFSPVFNLADTYISVGVLYLLLFQRKFFVSK
jgi:signal peptidase II